MTDNGALIDFYPPRDWLQTTVQKNSSNHFFSHFQDFSSLWSAIIRSNSVLVSVDSPAGQYSVSIIGKSWRVI